LSDAPTSATLRGRKRLVSRSPVMWSGMTAMMHDMVTPDDRRA
jgi:hypothetical protein